MEWKWKWSQESPTSFKSLFDGPCTSRPKFVDVIACPAMLSTRPALVAGCGNAPGSHACATDSPPSSRADQPSSHLQGFWPFIIIIFAFKTDWAFLVSLIPCVALTTIIGPSSLLCPKCDRWRYCYTHCLLSLGHAHIAGDGKLHSASHPMLVSYTTSILKLIGDIYPQVRSMADGTS